MRIDDWRAMVSAELDAIEAWVKSELENLPHYGEMMLVRDVDTVRAEYARRLESIVGPMIAMVEQDDPAFARERREGLARTVAELRCPSRPEGWLQST